MNPKFIGSANIIQFGFKADFDLENRKLNFDITGLTTFETGGAAAVVGINFEVKDPSNVLLSEIDFPTVDINPDATQTYQLNLPSGIALFGFYNIRGVIKDADGKLYEIKLPPKQVCEPAGFSKGSVPGSFQMDVDCDVPRLRVKETTNLSYQGLSPLSKVKDGRLYYPDGTIDEKTFTYTPFDQRTVYTGDYTIRNKTTAKYDLGDGVIVTVVYNSTYRKSVTCQSLVADIACCLEDVQEEAKRYCNTGRGNIAKEKINRATPALIMALAKEKAGVDASDSIAEIRDILGCDCKCDPKLLDAAPANLVNPEGSERTFVFEGECAAEVTPETVGDQTTVTVKVKNVKVIKGDSEDDGWDIEKTEDDCNINYTITLNYEAIADYVLTEIYNSTELKNYLNTLINISNGGVDLSGLDGKCILNLSQCDYTTTKLVKAGLTYNILSIIIGGVTYVAPNDTLFTDDTAVEAWLNGLGKGDFNLTTQASGSDTLVTITTLQNENKVTVVNLENVTDDKNETSVFTSTCKSLKEILQAIMTYICCLNTQQVILGGEIELCYPEEVGGPVKTNQKFGSDYQLFNFISKISLAICDLYSKVSNAAALTCAKMKTLFVTSSSTFDPTKDFFLGTKAEGCARITADDAARILLNRIISNQELLVMFCHANQLCGNTPGGGGGTVNCPEVTAILATYSSSNINISGIGWSTLPAANQAVEVWYKECGGDDPYVQVSANTIVLPDGSFQAPVNIAGLEEGTCYSIFVKNTACGIGKYREITTLEYPGTAFVTFMNNLLIGVIEEIEIEDVNVMNTPITSGNGEPVDVFAYLGGAKKTEVLLTGVADGTILRWQQERLGVTIAGDNFTYGAGITEVDDITYEAGDVITIHRADRDLMSHNYTASPIRGGSCSFQVLVHRNQGAIDDSVANNRTVTVTLQVMADNGCDGEFAVVMIAGQSSAVSDPLSLNCNGNECTDMNVNSISVATP